MSNIENMSIDQVFNPTKLEVISNDGLPLDTQRLNEAVDSFGKETKEFGISECIDSAKRIFTPEVLDNWGSLSPEQRTKLVNEYAGCVAENFQLVDYRGVKIEPMEDKNGYNRGDGLVHLSDHLIQSQSSPLQIVDTVTHELRHQYQIECVEGYHNVPSDTRKEWYAGISTYTSEAPWAEDPIGYKYNPLETDARYAGTTVAQSLAKDYLIG